MMFGACFMVMDGNGGYKRLVQDFERSENITIDWLLHRHRSSRCTRLLVLTDRLWGSGTPPNKHYMI